MPTRTKSEVAHARIGYQALHVALAEGHYPAPEDTGDSEPHRDRREGPGGFGEERDGEAEHPVAAGLEEEARQQDRAGGGRLGMRVGQPGVEAEGRELYGEAGEEAEHEEHLEGRRQRSGERSAKELVVGEAPVAGARAVGGVEAGYGRDHEEAARLGEDEELDRGAMPALMAPDVDHEEHGHQHELPHEGEEEEVAREEDPVDSRQGEGKVEVEEGDAFLDSLPGGDDGHRA